MTLVQHFSVKITAIFGISALLLLLGFFVAYAQEEVTAADADAQAEELVALDEDISHEDLDVGDPTILPDSPFYVFKRFARGFQSFFTFDPIKKAELKIKFASEKIIEAKKLSDRGASDEVLQSALENYENEVAAVKTEIESLKDSVETTRIEALVKKTIDNQIKHHKLLGKFMREHEDIAPEIEAKKAEVMRHFSESIASVVEPEVLRQKFEEAIQEQKGSVFRHFKNIEVLEEVKDFVPENARDAIQKAIEQSSKFFEEEFSRAEEEQRKIFNKYIDKIGGNEVRHLEVFDSITAFADIEEAAFEEMERAREKTRERIEKRMRSIEDETRKKVFISHLEGGKMEDARIIKELENNLDPETIRAVLDIKHTMEQRMRERFENAQSAGDLDSFFDEIDGTHDVRMMEVLKEMENIIPEDKREFWEEMKVKAMTEMNADIEEARRFGRLDDKLRSFAGFDPEQIDIIAGFEGEFGDRFNFFEDIKREHAESVQGRFEQFRGFVEEHEGDENFEDFFGRAEEFRLRIQSDPSVFEQIKQFAPGIQGHFDEFDRDTRGFGFDIGKVNRVIQDAERAINNLDSQIANADPAHPGLEAARRLLKEAGAHLGDARSALAVDDAGYAFGQATSASHIAYSGVRHLETAAFEHERRVYFNERDDFIGKFLDLPPDERPDPSEFIEFKNVFSSDLRPDFRFVGPAEREHIVCAQVITPARHATGKCAVFPNACLPPGWERDESCAKQADVRPDEGIFQDHDRLEEFRRFEETRIIEPVPTDEFRRLEEQKRLEEERDFFKFPEIGVPFPGSEPVTLPFLPILPIEPTPDTALEENRLFELKKQESTSFDILEKFRRLCNERSGKIVSPKECRLPIGKIVGPSFFGL